MTARSQYTAVSRSHSVQCRAAGSSAGTVIVELPNTAVPKARIVHFKCYCRTSQNLLMALWLTLSSLGKAFSGITYCFPFTTLFFIFSELMSSGIGRWIHSECVIITDNTIGCLCTRNLTLTLLSLNY